jgi:formate hydrogenlyase subunit 3/multisubunit Na+/H+ antiporter MnhD subunit
MRGWAARFSRYAWTRSVSGFAFLKLCLFASGLACGILAANRRKKLRKTVSLVLFLATYVPLITGFLCSASAPETANTEDTPQTEGRIVQ